MESKPLFNLPTPRNQQIIAIRTISAIRYGGFGSFSNNKVTFLGVGSLEFHKCENLLLRGHKLNILGKQRDTRRLSL